MAQPFSNVRFELRMAGCFAAQVGQLKMAPPRFVWSNFSRCFGYFPAIVTVG